MAQLSQATLVIGAAAVSDFRVKTLAAQKLKRKGPLALELLPTEDIIAAAARARRPGAMVIAFAAETEHILEEARRKLASKGVDAVVANDVSLEGLGFEADRNAGWFVTHDEVVTLPEGSKRDMADAILNQAVRLRAAVPV